MIRNRSIDICKGIAILAMIIGHCGFPYMPLINSFHMPLFFIIAGYVFKNKKVSESLKVDCKRLLIPYVVFGLIFVIKFTITKGIMGGAPIMPYIEDFIWATGSDSNSEILFGNISCIGAIWFLPAMFWRKTIYNLINKVVSNYAVRMFVIFLLTIVSIYVHNNVINLPFGILTGCSALLFFAIGHHVRKIDFSSANKILVGTLIVIWVYDFSFSNMSMAGCHYEFLPLNFVGAFGGTLFVYMLSKAIDKRMEILSQIISWCGKYSMVILCFHFLNAIIDLEKRLGTSNWILLFIAQLIILVPIVFTCCRLRITRKLFSIK